MIWTEVKYEGYDFYIMSGDWSVRREGRYIGLYYYDNRIDWCKDVKDGMFRAWIMELKGKRESG